jgi:hypothetical protein
MKKPMSNIVFVFVLTTGMAAGTLSKGNIRDVISNAPAPRPKVIEISLKPSRRL